MEKAISFIKQQLIKIALNPAYILSCCIPKNKKLCLFSAWFGQKFSDNPKYIYEYALKKSDTEPVWFTKDKNLYNEMRLQQYPVIYSASIKGIWFQMRAGIIVFSHSHWSDFQSHFIGHKTVRVQTWHGAPLKKIGKDDKFSARGGVHQKISHILFPHMRERFDLILATGEPDKKIFSRAFDTPHNKIAVTGYPRNDVFNFDCSFLSKKPKKLLYMPTFRGAPGSNFTLLNRENFNLPVIDEKLIKNNATLDIKLHPVQNLDKEIRQNINSSQRVKVINDPRDTYSLLKDYDALITDYSSIFFDFLLSGKPIYMLPIDKESYISRDREIYYNYDEVCPSAPQGNWIDMIEYIFNEGYPINRHLKLTSNFHNNCDNKSSARAYQKIISQI